MSGTGSNHMIFTLGNPNLPGVIYLSTDPSQNTLTLTLRCEAAIDLTPATLVPIGQASGVGSTFYLDMSRLKLDPATFASLQVVAEGWSAKVFSDVDGDMLALTPDADLTLQALQSQSFVIQAFVLQKAPDGYSTTLDLLTFGVKGVAEGTAPQMSCAAVTFVAPPLGNLNLADALVLTVSPADGLGVSLAPYPPIENYLTFTLSQIHNAACPTANASTIFRLSAAYSDDPEHYGALMTINESNTVDIPNPGAGNWTTTSEGAYGRTWLLQPTAGEALLVAGSVNFVLGPVETYAHAGPTVLLLSYSGVPGYDDGAFAITIQKQPHVSIDSFEIYPAQSVMTGPNVSVTACWTTSHATSLQLYYGESGPHDVTNLTQWTIPPITASINVYLEATGYGPGNVDNRAIGQTIQAVVQPEVSAFSASPAAIYARDTVTSYPVTVSWDVIGAPQVSVALGDGNQEQFSAQGQRTDNLGASGAHSYNLTAQCSDAGPPVRQSLTIPTYLANTRQIPINYAASSIAAVPNLPFVAKCDAGSDAFSIYSTATGNLLARMDVSQYFTLPLSNPFPIPPVTGAISFSPDGKIMLVSQGSASGFQIEVYSVTASAGPESFTATHLQSLPFDQYTVGAIAIPEAECFCVAMNNVNSWCSGQLVLFNVDSGGNYAAQPVAPPSNILPFFVFNGLAFEKDCICMSFQSSPPYVYYLGDSCWSPIDQNPRGSLLSSPDGSTLVAYGGNNVTFYDIPFTGKPRLNLSANGPTAMGFILGGEYAVFASADGANLINVALGTILPPVSIPQGFTAMCVMSDGTMVFGSETNSALILLNFVAHSSTVGLDIQASDTYSNIPGGGATILLAPVTADALLSVLNLMPSKQNDTQPEQGQPYAFVCDRTVDAEGTTTFTVQQISSVLGYQPQTYALQHLALKTPINVQTGQVIGVFNTGIFDIYVNSVDGTANSVYILSPFSPEIGLSVTCPAGFTGTPFQACGWNFTGFS